MTKKLTIESEESDVEVRRKALEAFQAVRVFLRNNAHGLRDLLSYSNRFGGCWTMYLDLAGLPYPNTMLVFYGEEHDNGTSFQSPYSVIFIGCLKDVRNLRSLPAEFASQMEGFVHEFVHIMSPGAQGRPGSESSTHVRSGDLTKYYNHDEETNAYYQEAAFRMETFIRTLMTHATPEVQRKYTGMTDRELLTFMITRYVNKGFLNHIMEDKQRKFLKRAMRFIHQTIIPMIRPTQGK